MTIGMLHVLRVSLAVWHNPFAGDEAKLGVLGAGEPIMVIDTVKNTNEQVVTEHGEVYCNMFKVVTRLGVGYANADMFLR